MFFWIRSLHTYQSVNLSSTSPPRSLPDQSDVDAFSKVVSEIEKGQSSIKSVEDFLSSSEIPDSLRSYYNLVYSSRSLQSGSSFQNPRAIVFSKNARVMYSFNGSPDQDGFNTIESAVFNEKTKQFDFREIDFSKPVGHQVELNPTKCLGCHATVDSRTGNGTLPHPLWDTYALWPGVYGSVDDEIFRTSTKEKLKQKGNHELKHFEAFLASAPKNPRYLKLKENKAEIDGELRPNLYFNIHLNDMMYEFVAHQLMKNANFRNNLKDFLESNIYDGRECLGIFKSCKDISQKEYDELIELNTAYVDSRKQRQLQLFPKSATEYLRYNEVVTDLIRGAPQILHSSWIFKMMLDSIGIDARSWSIDMFPRSFNFYTGTKMRLLADVFEIYAAYDVCGDRFLEDAHAPDVLSAHLDIEDDDFGTNFEKANACLNLN